MKLCHPEPQNATSTQAPTQQGAEQHVTVSPAAEHPWGEPDYPMGDTVGSWEGLSDPYPSGVSFQEFCGRCTNLHEKSVGVPKANATAGAQGRTFEETGQCADPGSGWSQSPGWPANPLSPLLTDSSSPKRVVCGFQNS